MGSIRNYYLAKELSVLFEKKLTAFITSNAKVLPKDHLNLDAFNIVHIPTFDYRSVSSGTSAAGVSESGGTLKQFVRKLKNSLPFSLILGLGGPIFLLAGIWKGYFYLRKNKDAVIISLSAPFIDHIIASVLKSIFPKTTWIADIQNLALEPDTDRVLFKGYQHWRYKRILKKATVITTVSEGLKPHLKNYNQTVEVVELGISSMYQNTRFKKNEKFTISYCGSLYPEQKFDILLLKLNELVESGLIKKEEIQFQYAGTNQNIWASQLNQYGFDSSNNDLGSISYEASRAVQAASNINLLLTWNTPNFKTIIPGKYYDYLSVAKPILMIINGDEDKDWEHRFQELQPGFMCYNSNSNKLEEFLEEQINLWRLGQNNSLDLQRSILERHLIKHQVKKLKKYLS